MDTSLFSRYQATQASAAQAVGTSLAPKSGAASNTRQATGATNPFAAKTATAQATSPTTGTSSTGTAASAATGGATITSSDFLTLLVSELKNQDPTAPTDPNEYITQLVGVNSLEQLISINTGITALDPPATTSTGTGTGTGSGVVPAATSVPPITAAPVQQASHSNRLAAGAGSI